MDLINLRDKHLKDIQRTFNFEVKFVNLPVLNLECLNYTCRKISIPGTDRKMKVIRYFGEEYTVALGSTTSHEVTLTFVLDSEYKNYNVLNNWFIAIQGASRFMFDNFVLAFLNVNLLSYDSKTINKTIQLTNVYPLSIPPIDGLDQDATEGMVTFDVRFAYDEIIRNIRL